MYNNNERKAIYLYNLQTGGYTHKFPTLTDCLKFLALNMEYSIKDHRWGYYNKYLNNLNLGNDFSNYEKMIKTYSEKLQRYVYDIENILVEKFYMFIDDYSRIIDVKMYLKEILYYFETDDTKFVNEWKKKKKRAIPTFIYRCDPVPYRGKLRSCSGYRNAKISNERRLNSDIEVQEFIRPKRRSKNLPNSWDCISVQKNRSWKDCTKKKRQWM